MVTVLVVCCLVLCVVVSCVIQSNDPLPLPSPQVDFKERFPAVVEAGIAEYPYALIGFTDWPSKEMEWGYMAQVSASLAM